MSTLQLLGLPESQHANAQVYGERTLHDRLIDRLTVPQVLEGLSFSSKLKPALTWYEGENQAQHYSYAELLKQIQRLANWFVIECGVECGDRVVVISSNSPEAFVAHLALMSIGAVTVPVRNTESPRILQLILEKVTPRLLVAGRDVPPELLQVKGVHVGFLPAFPLQERVGEDKFKWASQAVKPDDPAVILFTSGTTSAPKGVSLSHYNLLVNADGLAKAHNLSKFPVHMCVLPLYHANAFGFSMIASIYASCHVVLCDGLPGLAIWSILKEQRVNIISLVPEMIRILSDSPVPRETIPDLHYVVSAAAPLQKAVARSFMESTHIDIHQGYGLSECVNFAATVPWNISKTDLDKTINAWEVPSIGPALFGCEISILREGGDQAAEEEEGEIVVSGHTLMLGYWSDIAATRKVFDGGYLRTGDLGFYAHVNGQRYFFVTGRKKEIIIRYGENLSPLAIEAELNALSSLCRFAVAGFSNELAGEEIGLYVLMPHTYKKEQAVLEIVRACPIRYRPRVIMFGSRPIPVTSTGKVKRSLLAKQFYAYKESLFGGEPVVKLSDDRNNNTTQE